MEIKFNHIQMHYFFSMFLIFSFYSELTSEEELISNKLKYNTEFDSFGKDAYLKEPFKGVELNFKKKFNILNEEIPSGNMPDGMILQPQEYIQIKGVDNRLLLFKGHFLIKFKKLPNLNDYADKHQITFVTSLSDINVAVFKSEDILEIKSKIDRISKDGNILSIELDIVDPFLEPN